MSGKPTRQQVEAEPAGRRLDRWVAEFVMGTVPRAVRALGSTEMVTVWSDNPNIVDGAWSAADLRRYGNPPCYAADWADVEQVVDRLGFKAKRVHRVTPEGGRPPVWWAGLDRAPWACNSAMGFDAVWASGETLPLSVRRAALLAALDPKGG